MAERREEDSDVRLWAQRDQQRKAVMDAFDAEFKGELDQTVRSSLRDIALTHNPKNYFSPFVPFFQSSGWGKSRLFVQWAKSDEDVASRCVNGVRGTPRWSVWTVYSKLIRHLNAHSHS